MQRRRNYFIKKRFQFSFAAGFVVLLLLESLLIAAFLVNLSNNTITTGYSGSVLRVERTSDFFLTSFMLGTFIVAGAVAIAGMLIFILLSHRIAGPLYRFEKTVKDIEAGDLTARISLRKKDEIIALKEALNVFVDSMDKRIGRIKRSLHEIRVLHAEKADPEVVGRKIAALEDEVKHFKVTQDLQKERR
ncbi:MAG: methyl-accepting chemotaxis protein [Candidatus Omnitrophica bacterium]|nr:methyl-accepting chemotaxis protein [Candidatus Omnitrophota bacterium]